MEGAPRPRQLVEAEHLTSWVLRIDPAASEALLLAARSQHLRRWQLPRSEFPAGRAGYLQWRKRLAVFHAEQASEILGRVGYDTITIEAVRRINLKQGLKQDPQVQTMEDALCLTFLELDSEAFANKHDVSKLATILKKTWSKMSERGRTLALELPFSPRLTALISSIVE